MAAHDMDELKSNGFYIEGEEDLDDDLNGENDEEKGEKAEFDEE